MTNILVSTICFINFDKRGAEIYATFANRLIDDVMTKTPYDIRVATNAPEMFMSAIETYGDRVSLHIDMLENNRVAVGAFNQLLKYLALDQVPFKYEWVLYLDCDAGLRRHNLDAADTRPAGMKVDEIENQIITWNDAGIDAVGIRTNAIVRQSLQVHEEALMEIKRQTEAGVPNVYVPMDLFSCKFSFYGITSKNIDPLWLDASMPSEHFLFLKNSSDGKLQKMSDRIAEFNKILIAQEGGHVTISDMEAFELGVSARVAGYTMVDAGDYGHNWMFAINFNGSNWERAKL